MASFSQRITAGEVAPYSGLVGLFAGETDYSWAEIKAAPGNTATYISNRIQLFTDDEDYLFHELSGVSYGFDLSTLTSGFTATAATLDVMVSQLQRDGGFDWSDTNAGVVLVAMDESLKAIADLDESDYTALQGSMTELSQVIPYTSLSVSSAETFTFNAAGLAYLNTVGGKANHPDQANFAVVFVGDARNVEPNADPAGFPRQDIIKVQFYSDFDAVEETDKALFSMTYTPNMLVNIGDVWKEAEDIQVNIGDVWKPVESIQVNIGDVWKDVS